MARVERVRVGRIDRSIALKLGPDGWRIAAIRNMLPTTPPPA
jgi:hypothetical protein